jgi:hypothetical protein
MMSSGGGQIDIFSLKEVQEREKMSKKVHGMVSDSKGFTKI